MLFLLLMYREILLLKSTYDEFIHEYIEDVIINIRKNLLTMVKKEKIEIMCNTQDLTYILNFVKYNPDIFVSKALSNIAECLYVFAKMENNICSNLLFSSTIICKHIAPRRASSFLDAPSLWRKETDFSQENIASGSTIYCSDIA